MVKSGVLTVQRCDHQPGVDTDVCQHLALRS
ncbi:MAG: hypothetical protein JWO76_508, partial [Nocardioides sp.]|nr:hypothetical protein [Nocardioides sp.]